MECVREWSDSTGACACVCMCERERENILSLIFTHTHTHTHTPAGPDAYGARLLMEPDLKCCSYFVSLTLCVRRRERHFYQIETSSVAAQTQKLGNEFGRHTKALFVSSTVSKKQLKKGRSGLSYVIKPLLC